MHPNNDTLGERLKLYVDGELSRLKPSTASLILCVVWSMMMQFILVSTPLVLKNSLWPSFSSASMRWHPLISMRSSASSCMSKRTSRTREGVKVHRLGASFARMSCFGSEAEIICSFRALPVVTHMRHAIDEPITLTIAPIAGQLVSPRRSPSSESNLHSNSPSPVRSTDVSHWSQSAAAETPWPRSKQEQR